MTTPRPQFTKIKGLSERRILPRLGRIKLGMKVKSARTGKEYPKELPYFLCPEEVRAVYGNEPKELDVLFPIESEDQCFPQSMRAYVFNGLRCRGDGETALRRVADVVWRKGEQILDDATERVRGTIPSDPNGLVEIGCPCPLHESGDCKYSAHLMLMLPRVSPSGVYQISSGSVNNIIRVNSCIDYIRALVGRIAMVPLKLYRQEEEIEYQGKKAKHYLLQLRLNADINQVAELRENARVILRSTRNLALPAPVDDPPEAASVVDYIEEEKDVSPSGEKVQDTETLPSSRIHEQPQIGEQNSQLSTEPDDMTPLQKAWAKVNELMEAREKPKAFMIQYMSKNRQKRDMKDYTEEDLRVFAMHLNSLGLGG